MPPSEFPLGPRAIDIEANKGPFPLLPALSHHGLVIVVCVVIGARRQEELVGIHHLLAGPRLLRGRQNGLRNGPGGHGAVLVVLAWQQAAKQAKGGNAQQLRPAKVLTLRVNQRRARNHQAAKTGRPHRLFSLGLGAQVKVLGAAAGVGRGNQQC